MKQHRFDIKLDSIDSLKIVDHETGDVVLAGIKDEEHEGNMFAAHRKAKKIRDQYESQ